ncbi:hypothetical protein AN478_11930 [Thiohalorhabdus denitrificans]|uniref:Kelch motif-containing protein n=1 Tax=Thiohalorhabdus denitrificans TaxID=381306 RepID=A0A0P9CJJ3_9GAMM|nr:hypothetical protein AN478_11930 [Thiohalorhabdus denitrificans]SCX79644.1 hypothetical protein SAMN05661077_0477 [Thiohalorhabdus denitrificans]
MLPVLFLAACGENSGNDDSGASGDRNGAGNPGQEEQEEAEPRAYTPEWPADTWVRQDPAVGERFNEDDAGGEPEYRPYAGVTAGDGRVYYWGGGHKTHDGNDIDAYDIRDNEWVQLTEEEDWTDVDDWDHLTAQEKQDIKDSNNAGWEVDLLSPRGRPVTKHSYAQMAWWPGHGYCLLKQRLWCYDPAMGDSDGAWQDLAEDPFPFDNTGQIAIWNLTYDPGLDTVVTVAGSGHNERAWAFDAQTGTWRTVVTAGSTGDAYTEVHSAYNPESGWHIVFAQNRWQRMNFGTGEVKEMAQLRHNGERVGASFSIEWAPELGKALVAKRLDGQLRMWTYDPRANAWSEFELAGDGPMNAHAKWDTLARDPETGVYVFLAKEDENAEEGETPETWTFWLSK